MKPYVYALIDPRNGETFYIGKGVGGRMYAHERDVRRGKVSNADKTARIAEIIAAGLSVTCQKLAEFDTHEEAYEAERQHIAALDALTNKTPGGEGGPAGARESLETWESLGAWVRDMAERMVPFDQWMCAKPRSTAEQALFRRVAGEIGWIDYLCRSSGGCNGAYA